MFKLFRKKRTTEVRIEDLFEGYQLPRFPRTIMDALDQLRQPDASINQVASRLEADPAMQVTILKKVNAAAFGLNREITNLHHAVTLMGKARLETILLTHAVADALPVVSAPEFSRRAFWRSAARRACLARAIASRLHPRTQVESFTAGLLQDMAVPVLIQQKTDEYAEILKAWNRDETVWLHDLEAEVLPFDHPTVGAAMARAWGLPRYLTRAISVHHAEHGASVLDPGVRLVSFLRDGEDPGAVSEMLHRAEDDYGLSLEVMQPLLDRAFEEAAELAAKLG